MPFTMPQTVLFQHCDPAGIVFYPRYFEMLNAAVEAWFDQRLHHPFALLHGPLRASVPTVRLEVTFAAPSRLGDALVISLALVALGRTSAGLRFGVDCGGERRLSMTSTVVCVSADTMRPQRWPDALGRALTADLDIASAPRTS